RQLHRKCGVAGRACHFDLSAQSQYERTRDVQPEPSSFSLSDEWIIEPAEFDEYLRQMLLGNAHALIADGKLDQLLRALDDFACHHIYYRLAGRIFDRVVDQVSQNLLQPVGISPDRRQTRGDSDGDAVIACFVCEVSHYALHCFVEIERAN